MKRIKFQLLLLLVMLMATSTAFAYNGTVVMTPADGVWVDSLKAFTITFSDEDSVQGGGYATLVYTLEYDEVTLYFKRVSGTQNSFTTTLKTAITTPGSYELKLPAGLFKFRNNHSSPAMTFHYFIKAIVEADPADGSVVSTLSKIGIKFPQNDGTPECNKQKVSASTVINDVTGESAVRKTEFSTDENGNLFLELTPAVAGSGRYTVTIPAGTFYIHKFLDDYNLPIELHYTVDNPNINGTVVMEPADFSIVDSLKTFTITFSDKEKVFAVKEAPLELYNEERTLVSQLDYSRGSSDNQILMTLPESVTAKGEYNLQIPYTAFIFEDSIYGAFSDALDYKYMVYPSPQMVAEPAISSEVQSLSKITITFPELSKANVIDVQKSTATITSDQTGESAVTSTSLSNGSLDNQIVLECTPINKWGSYTVTIPANTLILDENVYIRPIVLHYKVNSALQIVADPADSSVVLELNKIGLEFPQLGTNFDGLIVNSGQSNASTVTNDATGQSAVIKTNLVQDEEDKSLIHLELTSAVTEPGNYTVTIPSESLKFFNGNDNGTLYDKPIYLHYTVSNPNINGAVEMTPADSSVVDSLKTFTITFCDKKCVFPSLVKKPALCREDGVLLSTLDCSKGSGDNQISMTLQTALTTPGIFLLQIPDSAFCFEDSTYGAHSTALTFHYMIRPPLHVEAAPADSSVVQSLSKIKLSFIDYGPNFEFSEANVNVATVINDSTGKSAVTKTELIRDSLDECIVYLECTPALTAAGNYTVTIPAGTFNLSWDTFSFECDQDIVLHYTVVPIQVVVDPADSSVVQSLSKIKIGFPQFGSRIGYFDPNNAITVINDATGESAVTSANLDWDEDDECLIDLILTPAVTDPGKYTVTIPANTFFLGDTPAYSLGYTTDEYDEIGIFCDQPIVLHYTINEATGITDVKVEGNLKGIRVNLNGQRVGDNYQGVVIVNGVKRIMK